MWVTAILIYLLTPRHILYGSAQEDCLRPANTNNQLPPFQETPTTLSNGGTGSQVIITSYQFHCCGNITAWQAYVNRGGNSRDGAYSINFQVWRPSSTVGSDGAGEYSLVGENRFQSLTLNAALVSETPQPTNVISVRPGDVVGYFLSTTSGPDDGIQLDAEYSHARLLWYMTSVTQDTSSTLVAGNAGTLRSSTNAGPVLSVGIDRIEASFSCSELPTSPLTGNFPTDVPTGNPIADASTTPQPHTGLTPSTTYVIVGVITGTFVFLFLLVITIIICLKRAKNKKVEKNKKPTSTDTFPTEVESTDDVNAIPLEVNECYSTNMPMKANESYGTAHISLEVNESYSTNMPMKSNESYATTSADIPQEDGEYDYVH